MAGLSRPLPPPHLLSIQRPWQPDPVSSSSSTPPIQAPAAAAVVRLLPSDDNPPRPKAVKSISAVKTISFSGCITCRLRKKKCDEGTPACEACKRLNVECLGYSKKRPPFLRDKDLSAQARTDLTNFLSRTGKVSNRGKNSAKSKAAASSAPLNEGSTFGFDAYRKMWEENEQGDVKGGEGRTSKKPKPPTLRSTASSSTSSTMASVREQQPVSPPDSEVVLSASPETSASTGYFSSRNTSIVSASCISNLGWASAEASPSWPDQSQFAVFYPISSSSSYQPQSYPRPPPHVQLPMGADVQYGPFTSPPWQQVALAMDEPDSIPRPLDSPLSRLNLPKEQYELIQIYVAHIDVYASLTVSDQELRQHNKLHHQLDQSDARCACMDEALTGNVITYKALQDPAFVNAASAMASKFRDLKLLCANDQASSTPTGLAGLDPTRRSSNLSQTHDKTDAYRHKSYSALVKNLNTGYSDLITALFTCQRLIWTNVYEGGVNGWKQPLETMRWCLQNLFQGITNRGTIALDVQSIDPRILFLLRRVVTIDLAACISSESTTPLYSFYRTLLTHPQFHLSTGSDLLSHVSSSNIICQIFLEGATLKGWKRASALTYNPNELAARAIPIQQLIDTLLGGSFEESLRRYSSDFDYFASPFRTMNFLCCQICAQAGQIYLSSTLYGNDPTHPAIASAVSAIIDLVAILPTQLCLPAIVFPLFLASVYSLPADRTWFVEIMSSRVLGPESDYLGNVGPMRVLRDEVWRAQDVWEVRGRQMGMERVDWQLVMRQLRMEILLM